MTKQTTSHLLVALQIAAIALCAVPFGSQAGHGALLVLCAAGGIVGLWTLLHNRPGNFGIYPELKDGCGLVTSGPYRWVRHPMYLSLLLLMLGVGLYNGQWPNYLGLALLWMALLGKMAREERYLAAAFATYADYRERTRRVIPFTY